MSGNAEYSEYFWEFLRGNVQKNAFASKQAAYKINMWIGYNTLKGAVKPIYKMIKCKKYLKN